MAFPVIADTNSLANNTVSNNHGIKLPPNISTGDLLLIFFVTDGDNDVDVWSDDFIEIFSMSDTKDIHLSIAYKIATGSEGATTSCHTTSAEKSVSVTYRITGHDSATAPEVSTGVSETTNMPNPDSLTPTGGAKDYLWIAVEGNDDDDANTGYPANYTLSQVDLVVPDPGGANVSVAGRNLNASSEDPPAFAIAASEQSIACTVVVHPITGETKNVYVDDSVNVSDSALIDVIVVEIKNIYVSDSINVSDDAIIGDYLIHWRFLDYQRTAMDAQDQPTTDYEPDGSDDLDFIFSFAVENRTEDSPSERWMLQYARTDGAEPGGGDWVDITTTTSLSVEADTVLVNENALTEAETKLAPTQGSSYSTEEFAIEKEGINEYPTSPGTNSIITEMWSAVQWGLHFGDNAIGGHYWFRVRNSFAANVWQRQRMYMIVSRVRDRRVSDSINVSDSVGIEYIPSAEVYEVAVSDSIDVSDAIGTETYKFFTSSIGDFIDVGDGVYVEKVSTFDKAVSDSVNVSDSVYIEKTEVAPTEVYVSDSIDVSDGVTLKGITKTWNAPSNGNWDIAANWLPVGVPQEGDKVVFNTTSTYNCLLDIIPIPIKSMKFDTGYTGTFDADNKTLTVTGDFVGTQGTFDAGESIIDIGGDWDISSALFFFTRGTTVIEFGGDSTQTIANNGKLLYDIKVSGSGQKTFTESFKSNDFRALNNVTVKFTPAKMWVTENGAQIYADTGYMLTLRSTSDGTWWNMLAGTGNVATRVDVKDSSNTGTDVNANSTTNIDSGHNVGWLFTKEIKDISDTVDISDAVVIEVFKFFSSSVSDFIDVSDSVLIEHIYEVFTKYPSDTINISDAVQVSTEKVKNVYISDSINVSDSQSTEHIYEIISKYISDAINVSDSVFIEHIYEVFEKHISDTINVSDSVLVEHIYEVIDKRVSDSVNVSDDLTIEHIFEIFTKKISDSINVSDDTTIEHIYEIIEKSVSDTINVTDSVWKEKVSDFDIRVSDDIEVSDAVYIEYTAKKTVDVYVSDTVNVSDDVLGRFQVPIIRPTRGIAKIVAGTATLDTTDDISSIDTKYGANLIPVANIKLNDKDGKYSTMSADLIVGNPIILSGSIDGGEEWFRIFSGSIVNMQGSLNPKQEMVSVMCQDRRLLVEWTDFNNSIQQNKDFGALFTGSPSSSAGVPWGTDSHGNYPDGLLHESGFTYSGLTDIYGDYPDMPGVLIHHHETLYEAVKKYTKLFAVSFFVNPNDDVIDFVSETESYPTLSQATISYGTDINSSNLMTDYKNYAETVIVHGHGHFYQSGSGEEPVIWVNESDLGVLEEARLKASQYYDDYSTQTKRGSITLPAYEHDVLGRRVTIDDDVHGWSGLGDIKELSHKITTDRWTTKLTVENVPIHAQKTIVDVLEELDDIKDSLDYGRTYDGFKFLDWNWDETESSDYSIYKDTESVGYTDKDDVPCLLAIGRGDDTASNPDTYNIHCSSLSHVAPFFDVLRSTSDDYNDSNYFYIGAYIDKNVNFTLSEHHTKEFVIYFYTHSEAPYFSRDSYSIKRPTTTMEWTGSEWDNDVGWNEHIIAETNTVNYIFQGQPTVFSKGDSVLPTDRKVKVKMAWQSESAVEPSDFYAYALTPTCSEWNTSGSYIDITLSDLQSMSIDAESKSENYYSYTHSVGIENEYVKVMFDVDFDMRGTPPESIVALVSQAVARVYYTKSDETTESNHWQLCPADYNKDYKGWGWWDYNHGGFPVGEWGQLSINNSHTCSTDGHWPDGRVRWAISPYLKVKANTDVVIEIAYFDTGYTYDKDKLVTVKERAKMSTDGETLALSYIPTGEVKVYFDSADSWFTSYQRLRLPNRCFKMGEDGLLRITDYKFMYLIYPVGSLLTNQHRPRELPANPYHRTNWKLWIDALWNACGTTRYNKKRWPNRILERHYTVIYEADSAQLPKKTQNYELGRDYEYRRPLSFEGSGASTSDGIVWVMESIDGSYPKHPAYLCSYSVAFDGYLRATGSTDEGQYSAQRFKYINFEGYDDTTLKDMTIQYRTTQSDQD